MKAMADIVRPVSDPSATTGCCHCGAVKYRVKEPFKFQFLCHCDNCRKLNGGQRLAGASVSESALTVEGETTSYTYAGGRDQIELRFCGRCGTPLFALPAAYPGTAVIRTNTLDDDGGFRPVKSLFGDQACAWDSLVG
jgi:hypothetical protein